MTFFLLTQAESTTQIQRTFLAGEICDPPATPNLYSQFASHRYTNVTVVATVESATNSTAQFRRVYFHITKQELVSSDTIEVRSWDRSGMPLAGRRQMRLTFSAQDEAGEWFTSQPTADIALFTVIYGGAPGDVVRLHVEAEIVHTRPW